MVAYLIWEIYEWIMTKITGKTSLQRLEEFYMQFPPVRKNSAGDRKKVKPRLIVIKGGRRQD